MSRKRSESEPFSVEIWPIDKPVDYPKNARKWSTQAISKVATSIREFGFRQPVVVDSEGVIVIGHLRRAAGKSIGLTECPVHVARDLSPAKIRALRLADNRTAQEASWDLNLLAQEFGELKEIGFDLSVTGFDSFQWTDNGGVSTPEWSGMPEFEQQNLLAKQTVMVHFLKEQDRESFAKLIGQPLTDKTKYVWYPKQENMDHKSIVYEDQNKTQPRHPIYVISKGRADSRLTVKALERIGVSFRVVIEPQEYDTYAAAIEPSRLLTLPFSNLGQGSIPARNWVWDHAMAEGHSRHWILDDNIRIFYRLHDNKKVPVSSGACFRAAEDFTERYTNVRLSGMQYQYLAKQKQKLGPYVLNTRIYSCILIDNSLTHRWRGRYNEDTDLSLRVLKDGDCTILFQAFLADKIATLTMKGGNSDELYKGDGRLKMAQSLHEQHPDVVKVTRKWGRWQHQVDYRPFKNNKFIPREGFEPPTEADNYGMVFQDLSNAEVAANA